MGYEDEKDEETLRRKSAIVKELIVEANKAIDRYFESRRKYDEERHGLDQKGIGSGVDEALHLVALELALELLKEDKALRDDLHAYIKKTFREYLLPQFEAAPGAPFRGKAT